MPGDFDIAQVTWRPDYDAYYYDELNKRARNMFAFATNTSSIDYLGIF